ncbi:phosphopantetheine-binding protein [Schaalia sp. ZJ1691]|uniref:phosphopantetheine-binding protein n=1 Tax=Schaalia sp. ZJ1691 TaxID=2709404 RepID=UPI0013ECD8AF|nr:phosphopantetheine-binding protein [Schaalia sp. ZJ1691]
MGTIAELLGYSLEPDPDATGADSGENAGSSSVIDAGANEKADEQREVAMAIVLDECDLAPAQARADLTLREDLEMDDLVLYAIVSRMEHEMKTSLSDDEVRSWVTLGDLLDAVAAVG